MAEPGNGLPSKSVKMKQQFPDDIPTKCNHLLIHLQEFQNHLILMLTT